MSFPAKFSVVSESKNYLACVNSFDRTFPATIRPVLASAHGRRLRVRDLAERETMSLDYCIRINYRDLARRKLFEKHEAERLILKSIIQNLQLPPMVRRAAVEKLNELPKNSSRVRIHNYCVLTGRNRAVYRNLRMSRIAFRTMALNGELPGIWKER